MPIRIEFDTNLPIRSIEAAQRLGNAFQRDLNLTIPPAFFLRMTPARAVRFSQVVERSLKGTPFQVEIESGAFVAPDMLESVLKINGLANKVNAISIIRSDSDNTAIAPMEPPKIVANKLTLKHTDLLRPVKTVCDTLALSLRSSVGRLMHGILPLGDYMLEGRLMAMGLKLDKADLALVRRIEINNFDLKEPKAQYHLQILQALFNPVQQDTLPHSNGKWIYDIMRQLGLSPADISRIMVDGSFMVDDISFDLGTRRDVDRVTIILSSGREVSFTASLDREEAAISHSEEEFGALLPVRAQTRIVQEVYGLHLFPGSQHRTVIFKEYLDGIALGLIYGMLTPDQRKGLAYKVGEMLGEFLSQTDSLPGDLNTLNIIVNETEEEGTTCRVCDLSSRENDEEAMAKHILPAILRDYADEKEYLLRGFTSRGGYKAGRIVASMRGHVTTSQRPTVTVRPKF